jgi:hypothetical protein
MNRRHFLNTSLAATLGATLPMTALADEAIRLSTDPFMVTNGTPIFTKGPLASNRVASTFATTPALAGPFDINLYDAEGAHMLSELTGKVRLVSLWSETFWPCLAELNEQAELQQLYADDQFEFLAILTQSPGNLSYADARKLLDADAAANIPLWVEANNGRRIAQSLAMMAAPFPVEMPGPSHGITTILPCTVLIDAKGVVRGRILGGRDTLKKQALRTRWQSPLPVAIPGLDKLPQRRPTLWSSGDADVFIKALKSGILDKI